MTAGTICPVPTTWAETAKWLGAGCSSQASQQPYRALESGRGQRVRDTTPDLVPATFLTAWTLSDRYSRDPRYPLPSHAFQLERSGSPSTPSTFAGHAPGPARSARRPRGVQRGAAFLCLQRHLVACTAHCGSSEPFWDALLGQT